MMLNAMGKHITDYDTARRIFLTCDNRNRHKNVELETRDILISEI